MTIDEVSDALESLACDAAANGFGGAYDLADKVFKAYCDLIVKPIIPYNPVTARVLPDYWSTHDEGEMFWANEKKGY